jgi:hypothetical protein
MHSVDNPRVSYQHQQLLYHMAVKSHDAMSSRVLGLPHPNRRGLTLQCSPTIEMRHFEIPEKKGSVVGSFPQGPRIPDQLSVYEQNCTARRNHGINRQEKEHCKENGRYKTVYKPADKVAIL